MQLSEVGVGWISRVIAINFKWNVISSFTIFRVLRIQRALDTYVRRHILLYHVKLVFLDET